MQVASIYSFCHCVFHPVQLFTKQQYFRFFQCGSICRWWNTCDWQKLKFVLGCTQNMVWKGENFKFDENSGKFSQGKEKETWSNAILPTEIYLHNCQQFKFERKTLTGFQFILHFLSSNADFIRLANWGMSSALNVAAMSVFEADVYQISDIIRCTVGSFIIHPTKQIFSGVHLNQPVCPSIHVFVCLSVCMFLCSFVLSAIPRLFG